MSRFYIPAEQIDGEHAYIKGEDVNHIKNVLRMKKGDGLIICDGRGGVYDTTIMSMNADNVDCLITAKLPNDTELKTRLVLFQGLPKKDKMELIIQKAVELGACEIVPVMMKRTIVKLEDEKKEIKKLQRWQSIAEGAAKQSGRGIIPTVSRVLSWSEALAKAREIEYNVIPYEKAENMSSSKEAFSIAAGKSSVGIFIGPEGGIDESELEQAIAAGVVPISLGKRILRTETAGLMALSVLMFQIETNEE